MLQRAQIQFTETGAQNVAQKIKVLGVESDEAAKGVSGLAGSIKTLAAAYVGLRGLSTAVSTIRSFDTIMLEVQAVTKGTTEDLKALSETAREMGYLTRYSATEGGEALLALSRNGFTAKESIDAVSSTLDLAIAGVLGLQEASDIAAISVRQFNLEAKDTGRVADVIVTTANASAQTVFDLAEAMKYAGGAASSLDIDIETTAAAMGVLANSGIRGSMGGTAMRSMLLSLANPTEKATKQLEALGLTVADVDLKSYSLDEIFRKLGESGMGVGEAAMIFDERSAVAASTLSKFNGKFTEFIAKNKEAAGAAKEAAATMNSGINNSFLELESVLEEVMLRMGDSGLKGATKGFIDSLTEGTKIVFGFDGAMQESSASGVIMASVLGSIGSAAIVASLKAVWSTVVGIGLALKAAYIANPWGMAITAVLSLSGALIPLLRNTDEIADKTAEAKKEATDAAAEYNALAYQYEYLAKKVNRTAFEESEYKKVIEQLQKLYPEHLGNLSLEKGLTEENTRALKDQKTELIENIALKMKQAELEGIAEKQLNLAKEIGLLEQAKKSWVIYHEAVSADPGANKHYASKFSGQADEIRSSTESIKSYEEQISEVQDKINELQGQAEGITNSYGEALLRLVESQDKDAEAKQPLIDTQTELNKINGDAILISEAQASALDALIDQEIELEVAREKARQEWLDWEKQMENKTYDWKPKKPDEDNTQTGLTDEQLAFNKRKDLYEMEVQYYTDYKEMIFGTEAEFQAKMKGLKAEYGDVVWGDPDKTKENLDTNKDLIQDFTGSVQQSLGDLFSGVASDFNSFMDSITSAIIRTMTNAMVVDFMSMLTGAGYAPNVSIPTIEAVFPETINKHALGGEYEAGKPRMTSEYGAEVDIPSHSGRILSRGDAMQALGSGGQPVNLKILNQVDDNMILQAMQTKAGERLVVNIISKYKNLIG